MCPMKYFIGYNLGITYPANIKADKGSVTHKVFELLAQEQLARQNGESEINDDHFGRLTIPLNLTHITNLSYNLYAKDSVHEWTDRDYKDVVAWIDKGLKYNGGMMDPRKQTVVLPESKFDFLLEYDWARYEFDYKGEKLVGQLGVHGTIDGIIRHDNSTYEIVDYKTGRRVDWGNNAKVKEYKHLERDPQLMLYYFAARRLYPNIPTILMTIFYINDGGAYSILFDDDTIVKTENMLRKHFENIKKTVVPRLNVKLHCKFCEYNKNKLEGDDITVCERIKTEVHQIGMNEVLNKRGQLKDFNRYAAGGGKQYDEQGNLIK